MSHTAPISVAVIGAGMAGRSHAHAYRTAQTVFGTDAPPTRLAAIADVNEEFARFTAERYGFERAETSWQAIVEADDIDAVSIVVANHLHREIAEALLASGKHVLCEKPLAPSVEDARAMVAAAEQAPGLVAATGFSYRRAPAIAAVAEQIRGGGLGQVLSFNGRYWCDYGADPDGATSWRYTGPVGSGALADIGSHLIDTAELLCGPIARVTGAVLPTVIKDRPVPLGCGARPRRHRGERRPRAGDQRRHRHVRRGVRERRRRHVLRVPRRPGPRQHARLRGLRQRRRGVLRPLCERRVRLRRQRPGPGHERLAPGAGRPRPPVRRGRAVDAVRRASATAARTSSPTRLARSSTRSPACPGCPGPRRSRRACATSWSRRRSWAPPRPDRRSRSPCERARLRIGVLGAARIADDGIVDPARALGHRIVAVAARDRARAEAFASEHGVERVHDGYQEVIDDPDVDVVYNALVNSLHAPWNLAALRAGKDVLSEKPMTSNAQPRPARSATPPRAPAYGSWRGSTTCTTPCTGGCASSSRRASSAPIERVEIELAIPTPPDTDPRWSRELDGGATMDLGCYVLNAARHLGHWIGATPRLSGVVATLWSPDVDSAVTADLDYSGGPSGRVHWDMDAAERRMIWTVRGSLATAVSPAFAVPHLDPRLVVTDCIGCRT